MILLHQNHTCIDLLPYLFEVVSQSYLKCYFLVYSPHIAPNKTLLTMLRLNFFLKFFKSVWKKKKKKRISLEATSSNLNLKFEYALWNMNASIFCALNLPSYLQSGFFFLKLFFKTCQVNVIFILTLKIYIHFI